MLHSILLVLALQGSLTRAGSGGDISLASQDSTRPAVVSSEHRRAVGDDSVPSVSLADAVRRSYRVAPGVIAAGGLVGTTAWQKRAAVLALTTPNVSVGGDLYSVTPQVFNFNVLPPTTSGFSALPLTSHTTDANITASYTLFNGGQNLSRIRAARFSQVSAEANSDAVRADTRVGVETAYYTVAADQELLRVATERVQSLTEELALARARVSAGAAVQTDSLQLVLELTTARVSLLQQQATTQVDRLALGRQTGASTPVAAEALDTIPPAALPFTLDRAVAQALETGPAYVRARAVERASGADLAVQEGSFLPTVTLSASRLAYGNQVLPSLLYRNQLAVSVSFPILDQGQREYGVAVASASLDSARAVRADLDRGARQDVTNAYDAYNTARATVLLQQTGVVVARENLRVATLRYQSGLENVLNLLTAQVSLTQAESDLVNARKNARLALASLQARLGKQLVREEVQ
jgi:outer membrane protein